MTHRQTREPIGVLFSGGLDSCILLAHLLAQGRVVHPIYIKTAVAWQAEELTAVHRCLHAMLSPRLRELVSLELPLEDLYGPHWSITGDSVPDDRTADEAVYLPGRNPLLLVKAAVWCQMNGVDELALAPLSSNPFPDASDEFFAAFEQAMSLAGGSRLRIVRPFAQLDKRQVMQLGRLCPLEHTFSCIAPVDGLHCGHCNKCAERRAAFASGGLADPTHYAGESQPTSHQRVFH
jgi:7-cyano-7-deazaguanine synthase